MAWLLDLEWRPFKPLDPYYVTPAAKEASPSSPDQTPMPEPGALEPEDTTTGQPSETTLEKEDNMDSSGKKNLINPLLSDADISLRPVEISQMSRLRNNFLRFCKPIKNRPKSFLAGFVITTSVLLLYFLTKPKKMYWNKYQYNTIAFYQNVDGAFIVPLDTFQLAHQKKLLDWSLITRNSIGIVHYSKINGKVEFYTTGGTNPEDTTRRLLPLTEYMFDKYIANKTKKN